MAEESEKRREERLIELKFEALNKFAKGVAHDFNNLLTSLSGNIALASMNIETNPENAEKKLKEAEEAIDRGRAFISMIISLTQGESTYKTATDVGGIIDKTTKEVFKDNPEGFELDTAQNLPGAHVNPDTLAVAVEKVLENAGKASAGKGPLRVTVDRKTVIAEDDLPLLSDDYLLISISDQGPGISENNMPCIFDPYFSGDPRTKGRGLAAAYAIIKELGGHIRAKSVPGKGSTFDIYLPLAEEGTKAAAGEAGATEGVKAGPGREEEKGSDYKARLLVLNEERIIKDLLEELLSPMGYDITFATNGEEAVAALKEGPGFDLAMLDLEGSGGTDVTELVKELKGIVSALKTVVSGSDLQNPIFSDHATYGFDAAVAKPFNFGELANLIEELTGKG